MRGADFRLDSDFLVSVEIERAAVNAMDLPLTAIRLRGKKPILVSAPEVLHHFLRVVVECKRKNLYIESFGCLLISCYSGGFGDMSCALSVWFRSSPWQRIGQRQRRLLVRGLAA
jgi:hypothetical protein